LGACGKKSNNQNLLITFPVERKRLYLSLFTILFAIITAAWFYSVNFILVPIIHFFVIALSEEFLIRSVVQQNIKKVAGDFWAIIVAALIFAFIIHLSNAFLDNLVLRLPIGIILGVVVFYARSIWPAVALHFAYNLIVV